MSDRFPTLRHLAYGTSAFAGMVVDDPVLVTVQAARRLPPQVRERLAALISGRSGGWRHAVSLWLRGHDDQARAAITTLLEHDGPAPRTLLAEIGVLLALPGSGEHGSRRTRAREAVRFGALSDAVDLAEGTGLARRYTSELEAMTPGNFLRTRPSGPGRRASGHSVLHLLTNSRPHTMSGYAVRSHQVLLAQRSAGLAVTAATRVGYPVTIGRPFTGDRDEVDGLCYHRLVPWQHAQTMEGRLRQQLALLRPLARQFSPSVLHTTTHYPNALVTRALADELGVPWVYEVRGVMEDSWVASFPPHLHATARASERHRLTRARETEVACAADAVVTLSRTLADDLITRGVPAERITVIPNGVSPSLFAHHESPQDARAALGLPSEGFWVGTVSSLVDYEGVDTLLDAVRRACDAGHDVRACIVGDGTARPGLLRRVSDLGLEEAVVMPGRVSSQEAPRWYAALDAFTVPRKDTDVTRRVTPIKHVTAMALGRPVVASDLPALAESTDGAAVLVRPDDAAAWAEALTTLAGDDGLRNDLAVRGREVAAARTWPALGVRYRELYEGLR